MQKINLEDAIYWKLAAKLDNSGFTTMDEYVNALLSKALQEEKNSSISDAERQTIEERLRQLGYM